MLLNDIVNISAGYPFRGKIPEQEASGIFCIQMKDISVLKQLNWSNMAEVKLTGKRTPNFLKQGDILFSARGNSNTAFHLQKTPVQNTVCAPYFFILRLKSEYHQSVLSTFVAWQINQRPIQNYFSRESEGSVTKSIRRNILENTPMAIPELSQQQNVVNLEETLHKEHQAYQKLLNNSQKIMGRVAFEFYQDSTKNITK